MTAERPRRLGPVLLVAGVVAAALVAAVVIVLVRRQPHPGTPGDAAREWAQAVVDGHARDARALECDSGVESVIHTMQLTVASISGVSTRAVTQQGAGRWQVELRLDPSATATFTVPVVRRAGRYLVCSDGS